MAETPKTLYVREELVSAANQKRGLPTTYCHYRPATPAEIAQAATAGRGPSALLGTGINLPAIPLYAFPELEQNTNA